jgi:hypothetical protein
MQSPLWFRLNHDDLANGVDEPGFRELPPLLSRFVVPSLQDKPQNPIVEHVRLTEKNREPVKEFTNIRPSLPPELHIITDDLVRFRLENENQQQGHSIWDKLDVHGNNRKVYALHSSSASQLICF